MNDRLERSTLSKHQTSEVARLLATALYDDPAYGFLFPKQAARSRGLADFFHGHLGTHVRHRCTFVRSARDGSLIATVTLRPPGGISVPPLVLALGLLRLAVGHGFESVRRLLSLKHVYENLERRVADGEAYWHVHMMAVRPDLQGQGIGGNLLREVLAAESRRSPVVLTTHKEINVYFYRRVGFEVVLRETVSLPGCKPYEVWGMRLLPC
jgi:ribosomal protein S18 acetylase RimI-like enzyme